VGALAAGGGEASAYLTLIGARLLQGLSELLVVYESRFGVVREFLLHFAG